MLLSLILSQIPLLDDVAAAKGANVQTFGRGGAIADLDGDGRLDLIVGNDGAWDYVLRQKPDGSYEDVSLAWDVPDDGLRTWGVLAADFDNDGDVDLYYPAGGFDEPERNRFLRNDLNVIGKFTNVTDFCGAAGAVDDATFGATALDYDRDGDLDIFATVNVNIDRVPGPPASCHLYRNDGGLYFTEVSLAAGIVDLGDWKHCSSGDFDNDGWIDIAAGNMKGPNALYRNNGDGTFTNVAVAAGVSDPLRNFGMVLDDFNNDGWLDVYAAKYFMNPTRPSGVYLNNGNGTFRDVTYSSGMGGQDDMGHNTGDLNGDSYPDIFVGTGHPFMANLDFLYMVEPNGNGLRITDVSDASGIRSPGPTRGHGAPMGDLNGDGFLDFFAVNGGPFDLPSTIETCALFYNRGNSNTWIKARLTGVWSNRSAVGARLHAQRDDGKSTWRQVTCGKGFANTDAAEQVLSLGTAGGVTQLDVIWPSGVTQTILPVALSSTVDLVETGIRLASPSTVPTGSSFTLEACGKAGHTVTPWIGEFLAEIPAPHLGGMARLRRPATPLPSFTLGAGGTGSAMVQIPNDPNLAGRTFHVQAQIVDSVALPTDLALTNTVTITIQ